MSDWKNASDYVFTLDLRPEQWAWQFLRRNPEYRKDYQWFIEIWHALEDDYGKAPDRDFNRWKQDPRAYVLDDWLKDLCEDDKSCASPDGDRILIECGMGAKWGFYKFPVNPDVEFPPIPKQLLWRDDEIEVSQAKGLAQAHEIDLRFDLRVTITEQLDHAKRLLIAEQRNARQLDWFFSVGMLTRLLRRLDAGIQAEGVIADELYQGNKNHYHDDSDILGSLLFGGYKKLLHARIES